MIVTKRIRQYVLFPMFFFIIVIFMVGACSSKEDKTSTVKPVIAPGPAVEAAPAVSPPNPTITSTPAESTDATKKIATSAVAVEVDGARLTTKQLEMEMQQKLSALKGQIPPESLEQAKMEIRRSLVDEFVVRTLLNNEVVQRKIAATDKEVTEVLDSMKSQLPSGVTMDELLKKNKIDTVKMRDEISLKIRINKLILQELGGKVSIGDKEVVQFYDKNKDKFKKPETVHARHILIATTPGDSEKIKADKKIRANDLRKRLLDGADFADLAKKNSDCPSKDAGGDLGSFSRGQMVKPFEDAAFSQEINAIGPVVETDFGFHIIQVLEHQIAQVMKLDAEAKRQIVTFLEREKQQQAFDGLVKKMKARANIVVYGK